nr:hypothetical protein CFP56_03587 [Quercus suber]
MHTESPSYTIGHIDHGSLPPTSSISPTLAMDSPHTESMSFMPTPGLHIDPMSMNLTHISSATLSSPVVVGFSVVGSEVEGYTHPHKAHRKHVEFLNKRIEMYDELALVVGDEGKNVVESSTTESIASKSHKRGRAPPSNDSVLTNLFD